MVAIHTYIRIHDCPHDAWWEIERKGLPPPMAICVQVAQFENFNMFP